MEKAKQALTRFYMRIGLSERAEKRWFWVAFSMLAVYFGYVVYAQNYNRGFDSWIIIAISAAASPAICLGCIRLLSKAELCTSAKNLRWTPYAIAGTVFFITFTVLYSWQSALYPGSFSPDSIEQYKQTQTGEFNDWHPVLHTWLFFGLPNIFSDSPSLIVTFQLIWFSLAVAYLYYVLYTDGCPKIFMAVSWIYIVANPNTALIMLYPWKDSAFTILALVMFSHLVRIYRSNGEWLLKWYNLAAFVMFAFLSNGVRHNAILLVAPMFPVLFVFLKKVRKRIALSAAIFAVLLLIFKFPICYAADVGDPKHRTTEVTGLPMTVLADVYMNDRDALSKDALEFLDSLATQENWEKHYTFGSFNSFKWSDGTIYDKIDREGVGNILKYTFEAAKNSPEVAKQSFFELTKMVWSIDGGSGWTIGYGITSNDVGIHAEYDNDSIGNIKIYRSMMNSFATKYLFNYVGVIIAVLLFVAVARIGKSGRARVFAVIPIMIYNFGTMLLLTGHDFRFFHLNFVIIVPLLHIMLTKREL